MILDAANFVETIETRQGITISVPHGEHLKAVAEGRVKY